jgi:asparagine N-glycosylation enzyme membrane subunit Stt3
VHQATPQASPVVHLTRSDLLLLLLACSGALALRVLPYADRVFMGDGILPSGDADVYYHLRRIELATKLWPRVPDFDAWINFPHGGYCPWPPLFDFIPATVARLTGMSTAWLAVTWPALLGALTIVPYWALLRGTCGRSAAWLATLLFVVLPANVAVSVLGRVDHHVAEILLQLWVYAWLARDLRELEAGATPRVSRSVGFGLLLGACLLTWAASFVFLWVPVAVGCLWLLPPRSAEQGRGLARHLLIAWGCAALCCAPFALLNVARGRAPFAYYHLSLLTLGLCLVMGALVPAWAWVTAPARASDWRAAGQRASAVLLALVSLLAVPGLRAALLGGLGFVGRKGGFVTEINESAPLLASALTRGFALQHVGYGHYLLPPLVLWLALRCWRNSQRSGGELLVVLWVLNGTVLAFMQARFLYYAAPAIAAAPWLATAAARRHSALRHLGTAAALLAIWPALAYYWAPLVQLGERVPLAQIEPSRLAFLLNVARVTPSAGDPSEPSVTPSYGIFAPWELGHELLAIAERAVVANNYGDQLEGGSFEDAQRFYTTIRDDSSALRLLARRRCRYLVTSSKAARRSPETLAARLHVADGSDLPGRPGSGHFRLIALAPQKDAAGLYTHKLFELVAGAELALPEGSDPGLRVVTAPSVDGQVFEYARAAVSSGSASARSLWLAYAGEYRVLDRGRELGRLTVPEEAVATGTRLDLARLLVASAR